MDRRAPSRGEKHGWLRFDRYEAIHRSALERHAFVVEDATSFRRVLDERSGAPVVSLTGTVLCAGSIIIDVEKRLDIRLHRRRAEVGGYFYAYNAHIAGRGNVLRYDNAHLETPDEYHRHEYELVTGTEMSRSVLTREQFPTLIEVVDELEGIARSAGLL